MYSYSLKLLIPLQYIYKFAALKFVTTLYHRIMDVLNLQYIVLVDYNIM